MSGTRNNRVSVSLLTASLLAALVVNMRFLEGRSATVKQEIGHRVLKILRRSFEQTASTAPLQITVEIRDIRPAEPRGRHEQFDRVVLIDTLVVTVPPSHSNFTASAIT